MHKFIHQYNWSILNWIWSEQPMTSQINQIDRDQPDLMDHGRSPWIPSTTLRCSEVDRGSSRWPNLRDTRSTGSIDWIHLDHPDPGKKIPQCAFYCVDSIVRIPLCDFYYALYCAGSIVRILLHTSSCRFYGNYCIFYCVFYHTFYYIPVLL